MDQPVTKAGKFNLDVDQQLRPLILRVEDLIDRFQTGAVVIQ